MENDQNIDLIDNQTIDVKDLLLPDCTINYHDDKCKCSICNTIKSKLAKRNE